MRGTQSTLTKREEKRLMRQKPKEGKVRAVFHPIEEQLRLLVSKQYLCTPSGTPVILNDEESATPLVVAIDNWFAYWKALSATQSAGINFQASDNLVAQLRRGADYVTPQHIQATRDLLKNLKQLYRRTPLDVSVEKFLDVKLGEFFHDDLEAHLQQWPELAHEVVRGPAE